MIPVRLAVSCLGLLAAVVLSPAAQAEERHALIISGAAGGAKFAENYDRWRTELVAILRDKLGFAPDLVLVLAEKSAEGQLVASREGVRKAVDTLRTRVKADDTLLIVLIGHGTYDGSDAKFNLVGPDMTADEWSALLKTVPGRLVFVNTTSASFPFVGRMAGPGRVVVTSTDSAAQVYETIFPQFFVQGLVDPGADLDKNGRISLWETFSFASTRVRQWYEQRGQLSTERPLLDDNADGTASEAAKPAGDGQVAHRLYLDAESAPAVSDDPELLALRQRQTRLEGEIGQLKARKALMSPGDYAKELERLLIELSTVAREIRRRSSSRSGVPPLVALPLASPEAEHAEDARHEP
jgi:hypothetical protein